MITEIKADILDLVEAIPNDTGLNVFIQPMVKEIFKDHELVLFYN